MENIEKKEPLAVEELEDPELEQVSGGGIETKLKNVQDDIPPIARRLTGWDDKKGDS